MRALRRTDEPMVARNRRPSPCSFRILLTANCILVAGLAITGASAAPDSQSSPCLDNAVNCVTEAPGKVMVAASATISSWTSGICSGIPTDQLPTCLANWAAGATSMSMNCWSDSTGSICQVRHDNGKTEWFWVPA